VVLNLTIAVAYVTLGNFAIFLPSTGLSVSPVWPPVGLALAMSLVFGLLQVWPGILIGTLTTCLLNSESLPLIMNHIVGNLLELLVAFNLLQALSKKSFKFRTPQDIFAFILIGVILAPVVSSTFEMAYLYLENLIETVDIPIKWTSSFLQNALGILLFTPLIYSFFSTDEIKRHRFLEALCLLSLLIFVGYWTFGGAELRKFLFIPLLTWAALRFSFRGVSLASLVVASIAIWRSTHLMGVFDKTSPEVDMMWIQFMTGGMAIVGYFMATVSVAQTVALEKEIELSINKKHKNIAQEALAILDQSIHLSPICFALIDRDYKYIRVNQATAQLHGIPLEAHLGKSLRDITPSTADLIEPMIDKVFATKEALMNRPFKGISVGLISFYPISHPPSEEIFAVAMSFQDMAEEIKTQNLLRENQDRLAFAQDAGKIGAFEWDAASGKIFWTTELEHIYGIGPGEFGGFHESWMKWIHPEDLDQTISAARNVLAGESELNHQFRIITKDRDTRWILARGKMVQDSEGNNIKFIGINIDLTEQKSTEQKLRVTEANLLHALSVRDEFMATASHELKTPLTSLKLQIQLFQRGVQKNDLHVYTPQKVQQLLEKNSGQIDRLTRLVDDMLDISRMRTGKLTLKKEPCEIGSVLKDILARTRDQFLASGSGLPLVTQTDRALGEWDPLRIEQVMTNIITNAIRYGKGKPISIDIKNYQDSVRISVKDQGLGIARSDLVKIFNRYERGLLSREVSGLGLGLFITQQIVEAHGGKIWVESEINQGATFFVDLPRITAPIHLGIEENEIQLAHHGDFF
jgi:PAS domain S-box-containing protein